MSRHAAIGESKSRLSAQSGTPAECFRSRDSVLHALEAQAIGSWPFGGQSASDVKAVSDVSGDFGIGKT